jgi:hypothetical protein
MAATTAFGMTVMPAASSFAAMMAVMTVTLGMAVIMMAAPVMPVVMMAAFYDFALFQRACDKRGNSLVRGSRDATVEVDTLAGQTVLSSSSDAAADEHVNAVLLQEVHKRPVARALRVRHLRRCHGSILDIVEFERLGPAEMREDRPIVVRHCYPHDFLASLRAARMGESPPSTGGKADVSPFDEKRLPVHKAVGHFFPRPFVDAGNGCPRNAHSGRCFLLTQFLQVKKANRFQLVVRQHNNCSRGYALGNESGVFGNYAYLSCSAIASSHYSPFPTYVTNKHTGKIPGVKWFYDICQN